jgi:hypothetical protein
MSEDVKSKEEIEETKDDPHYWKEEYIPIGNGHVGYKLIFYNSQGKTDPEARPRFVPMKSSSETNFPFYFWIAQIPSSKLSANAKIVYCQLAHWSNKWGVVLKSYKQIGNATGMRVNEAEKAVKELIDIKLMGSFQANSYGVDHYNFYDHPWICEPTDYSF